MARERQQSTLATWSIAAFVAVAAHLLSFYGLSFATHHEPKSPTERPAVRGRPMPFLSNAEAKKLLARVSKQPVPLVAAPKEEKKKKKEPKNQKRQIVEIPPPKNQEVPAEARFASSYNSKVEREQISNSNTAPTPRMRKSDRRLISKGNDENGTTRANPRPPSAKKHKRRTKVARKGKAERRGQKPGPKARKRAAKLKVEQRKSTDLVAGDGLFTPKLDPAKPQVAAAPSGGGRMGGMPTPSDYRALLPSMGPQELARHDGSIDHIEDVDHGTETMLNTREFKYAWFFNRVKRSVQERWKAVEAHRRYDPYGRIYGIRDRHSVVQVTLNADGTLDDIHLTKDSGVAFLDEAALQAFHDAQPFPNPPNGLRDADGRIRFQFGFYLDLSGRSRMFRY